MPVAVAEAARRSTMDSLPPLRPPPAAILPADTYLFRTGDLYAVDTVLAPNLAAPAGEGVDRLVGTVPLALHATTADGRGYVVALPLASGPRQMLISASSGWPGLCLRTVVRFQHGDLRADAEPGAFVYVFAVVGDQARVGPSSRAPQWSALVPRQALSTEACASESPRWAPAAWPRVGDEADGHAACVFAAAASGSWAVRLNAGTPIWRRRQQGHWTLVQAWSAGWRLQGWLSPGVPASTPLELMSLASTVEVGESLKVEAAALTPVVVHRRQVTATGVVFRVTALVPWQGGHLLLPASLPESALTPLPEGAIEGFQWSRRLGDAGCEMGS